MVSLSERTLMPPTWAAGWNISGYLPETDPETFEDWQDAHGYLYETVQRFWDEDAMLDGEPDDDGPDAIWLPVDTALNLATHGQPFSVTNGDGRLVFWIEVAE